MKVFLVPLLEKLHYLRSLTILISSSNAWSLIFRLAEVIHSNKKLVLVFEYVEMDLKKFFSQFSRE